MLATGPRSTYSLPPSPRPGERDLAKQILASIRGEIQSSNELRLGTATTGCDGMATINPLDGTLCNGDVADASACDLVLYNPQTRSVVTKTVGRAFSSSLASCQQIVLPPTGLNKFTYHVTPPDCAKVVAALRARRRFRDNLGNEYGPDGAFLSHSNALAVLETEYIHRLVTGRTYDPIEDPPLWQAPGLAYLEKAAGVTASVTAMLRTLSYSSYWPAIHDVTIAPVAIAMTVLPFTGLDDAVFVAPDDLAADSRAFYVQIDSTGTPDTFSYSTDGFAIVGNSLVGSMAGTLVPITGVAQSLGFGVTVTFGATTGHGLLDTWVMAKCPNNNISRAGVGIRGTITEVIACVNGGFANNNIMVTCEDDTKSGHSLIVRDADSLALLYTASGHTGISSATGEKWSFSANDEGLFFAHSYLTAADKRKVAVISVNPLTFEPTITEIITLETNEWTADFTFAVAMTAP